jgi:next-to-BRCA1 protein 1
LLTRKSIYGIRYKCQVCPDWDYCSDCIDLAPVAHNGHRFAPIYDAIPLHPLKHTSGLVHYGIYCDGPLCKGVQQYIRGLRYKCAVCADVDFCANCESSPALEHNKTHPLIKFKSPVRSCQITTEVRDRDVTYHGDGNKQTFDETVASASKPTAPSPPAGFEGVHGCIKPAPPALPTRDPVEVEKDRIQSEKLQIKNLLSGPIPQPALDDQQKLMLKNILHSRNALRPEDPTELQAHFVYDFIKDESPIAANTTFIQGWVLRNPGPQAWPAGSSVRFVGGDNMLNIDTAHPSAEADMRKAAETNVLRYDVLPGRTYTFTTVLKAPQRIGCAISYWRLKTPNGQAFGHRLWTHINVVDKQDTASLPKSSVENLMRDIRSPDQARSRIATDKQQEKPQETPYTSSGSRNTLLDEIRNPEQFRSRIAELREAREARQNILNQRLSFRPKSMNAPKVVNGSTEEKAVTIPTAAPESVSIPAVAEPVAQLKVESEPKTEEEQNDAASEITDVEEIKKEELEEDNLFEDAETVSITDSEGSPLFTDDEYEILNASDEEGFKA